MEDVFGTKELYDISLKSTFPMRIGKREIEENETILHFDSIELSSLDTVTSRVAAVGGFDNRPQVIWEQVRQINYSLKRGVLSKTSWALISNSQISNYEKGANKIAISHNEVIELDENGKGELKYEPFIIFIYDLDNGVKIKDYTLNGKEINLANQPYKRLLVDYQFYYNNEEYNILTIGKRLLEGYLSLEGKIELKDDKDGHEKTGILKIPKLTLVTDLSIRLGKNAQPMTGNIEAIGFPVGSRGNSMVCSITFLEEDLKSDV